MSNQKPMIAGLIIVVILLIGGVLFAASRRATAPEATPIANQPVASVEASPLAMEEATTSELMVESTTSASPLASGARGATNSAATVGVKEFTVTGSNFKFAPVQLTVKRGDTVKINFVNSGGFHDFVIDDFNVKTDRINGGQTDTVQFVASKAGTFEFYCSVGNHRQMGMKGTLVVQ